MKTEQNTANPNSDFATEGLIEALQGKLDCLVEEGVGHYNKPGMVLVESMICRYHNKPSRFLLSRIQQNLECLASDFREAKEQTAEPRDSSESLLSPSERIRKLRLQVESGEVTNPAYSGNLSFDDFLMSQELEILESVCSDQSSVTEPDAGQAAEREPLTELRSIKHFRESWVKLNSERLLAQAIADTPKDAGPLNSHRLAIQSLTAMRDLSPEYLNRFLSYLETLLWLEKAGEGIGLNPRGKPRKPNANR